MKTYKKNLKKTVYALIVLFVISFFAGFLQSTIFEFVIYVFYFILALVGIKLIFMTLKSKETKILKVFLLLTGLSSTLYFLFFVYAFVGSILTNMELLEILTDLEGLMYLDSVLLLIGVIGSIILFKRK